MTIERVRTGAHVSGLWSRSRGNTPSHSPEKVKTLLKAILVDGRHRKDVGAELGINPEIVSAIARGAIYSTMRAQLIKELRAEGHTIVLR